MSWNVFVAFMLFSVWRGQLTENSRGWLGECVKLSTQVNVVQFHNLLSGHKIIVDDSVENVLHLHLSTVAGPASTIFFQVHSVMLLCDFFLSSTLLCDKYVPNIPVCLLTCPNHLSCLLPTVFNKLSASPNNPTIVDRTSECVAYAVWLVKH